MSCQQLFLILMTLIFPAIFSGCIGNFVLAEEAICVRGRQLIASGKLEDAVLFFQKALQADPKNAEINEEYNALRAAIKLRQELPNEKNAVAWGIGAERLRRYYLKYHVDSENVYLSLEIYHRNQTVSNAVIVVDAFLKTEQYQEALNFVNSQKQPSLAVPLQVEKARIYCMAEHPDQAWQIVREISIEKLNSPDTLLRLARIQGLTRQFASTVKTLKRCFELTPPNVLPWLKKEAENFPEFQPILSSSEFTAVMATRSTLASGDMECSKKWIGLTIDERPKYLRNVTNGKINFDDWQLP